MPLNVSDNNNFVLSVSARGQAVDRQVQRCNELNSAYITRYLIPMVSECTASDTELFDNCLTFDNINVVTGVRK